MDYEKKSLFLTSTAFDAATITATSQVATLPVSNLQTQQPARKYRANSTSYRIDIDLGAGNELACNTAVLIGHNGSSIAMGTVLGGDSLLEVSGGVPDVTSGDQSAWPAFGKPTERNWPQYSSLFQWDNNLAKRYWSFAWNDPANPDGFAQAGRFMIGVGFRPKFNISGNPMVGLITAGVQRRSAFNRIYTDPRGPIFRRLDVPINTLNERDMWDSLFEMQRLLGVTQDFFFSANPAEEEYFHKWSGQFVFEDLSRFQANMQFDDYGRIWSTNFGLLELV